MVRIVDSKVYIMDTEDFSIEEMPKSVFIQSKVLGIPCETRYEGILRDFDLNQLRAGMIEYGVDYVLKEICDLNDRVYYTQSDYSGAMPLSSLANVVHDSLKEIRVLADSSTSVSSEDLEGFNTVLESLRGDYYLEEDDTDEAIFGEGIVSEDSSSYEEDDFDDSDMYDYDDDDGADCYNDSEEDFEDSSEDMFSVARLYGLLSKEQVDLLKAYYKWYSKRVFLNENGSLHLDTIRSIRYQEWKKKELAQIRGDEEWSYEGCIDTGAYPGAYCEMGHALRYVHFAKGSESGKVVSFGNKCVSDFFEVDTVVMRAIRKAQVESTNDLVELYRIYSDDVKLDNARNSFKVLDFVIDKMEEQGKTRLGVVKLALDFKRLGLVYPKTLVKELKKGILGLDSLRDLAVSQKPRTSLMGICFGDEGLQVDTLLQKRYYWRSWSQSSLLYPRDNCDFNACCFFDWLWGIEFDGIHRYNPVLGQNVRDEGGKSKKAIKIYTTREEYAKKSMFYGDDPIVSAQSVIHTISSMINANSMFESFKDRWKLPYLNAYDSKYHNLDAVKDCKCSAYELLNKLVSDYNGYSDKVWLDYAQKYIQASHCLSNFKSGFTEVCKSVVLDEKPVEVTGYEDLRNLSYSALSVDDSINKLQLSVDRVLESPLASYFEKKESFGLAVFDTVRKTKRVSTKQASVLSRMVESLIEILVKLDNSDFQAIKSKGDLSKEQLDMIDRAISVLEDGKYFNLVIKVVPTDSLLKLKNVLISVSKRKMASERQMYYVNLAQTLIDEVDKDTRG